MVPFSISFKAKRIGLNIRLKTSTLTMNKKLGIIVFLSLIMLLSIAVEPSIADNLPFEQPNGVGYSDKLVPGTELSWKVTKATGILNETQIAYNYKLTEGGTFKIKLLKDPDEVVQNDYTELFSTHEAWAEFYINNQLVGTDATYFNDVIGGTELTSPILVTWIFPTVFIYSDGNRSSFQVLYDAFEPIQTHLETTTTGVELTFDYSVSLSDKTFEMLIQLDTTFDLLGQTVSVKLSLHVMYDINYGIMILYHLKSETSTTDTKDNGELRIESTTPGAVKPPSEAPFELFYAVLALTVLSISVMALKKKKIVKL